MLAARSLSIQTKRRAVHLFTFCPHANVPHQRACVPKPVLLIIIQLVGADRSCWAAQTDVAIVAERQRMMEEWKEWYSTKEEWMAWHQEGLAQLLGSELQVCRVPLVVLLVMHQPRLHQPWRLDGCDPCVRSRRRASTPWRRWRPRPCCPPPSRSSRPRGRVGRVSTCAASLPLLLMVLRCCLGVSQSLSKACACSRRAAVRASIGGLYYRVNRMASRRADGWQHLTHFLLFNGIAV